MAARPGRDMTTVEFHAWSAERARCSEVRARADECGGPTLSLVSEPNQQEAWPTDLLAPSAPGSDDPAGDMGSDAASHAPAITATPFDGVDLPDSRNRLAGWSADRQRTFLSALAETGSVHLASNHARLSARSAYRLRTRSPAFARAWDSALTLSVGRLSAIVFDRAIHGRIEQVYRDGDLSASAACPMTACSPGCSPGSILSASLYHGSSAATPIRRPRPSRHFRRCSTALPMSPWLTDIARHQCEHWDHWPDSLVPKRLQTVMIPTRR